MSIPCGYQQITSLSAATRLTVPDAGAIVGANQHPTRCIITATTQAVRWRDDGTDPTATVGYPLPVNTELKYDGNLMKIKFIEQTAGAVLNVAYYY